MLAAPARGCLNIHASLLPRWRGAAPIQAAILAGDAESGVTIMQMDAGLDTGDMLLQARVPLDGASTASALHDTLAGLGAALVLRALAEAPLPMPQPTDGVTYAAKLTSEDGRLDWSLGAATLERRIRALNPWPGTFTHLDAERVKVLAAVQADGDGAPGTLLDDALLVATGAGALRLTRVQAAGRAALPADAFLRGRRAPAGAVLH
jgi:methionyl-tRNA formyltransferase